LPNKSQSISDAKKPNAREIASASHVSSPDASIASKPNPNTYRGECPVCGKGVYSFQPRTYQNDAYFHEECLVSNTEAQALSLFNRLKESPSPAGADSPLARRFLTLESVPASAGAVSSRIRPNPGNSVGISSQSSVAAELEELLESFKKSPAKAGVAHKSE
jgi:hypothetical protein